MKNFADGDVPIDYFKAGALLADWAVVQDQGKMNALALISTGALSTDSMVAGINDELKHCANCKQQDDELPGAGLGHAHHAGRAGGAARRSDRQLHHRHL